MEAAAFINTAFADITKVGNIFVECKSWKTTGMSFQKFVAGESGSYNQFKTYLSQINSLNELEYWFDGNKITGDKIAVVKGKFQELFKKVNNDGYPVIYLQKPSLFNIGGITSAADFLKIVNSNNYNHPIDFIKIK